MTINEQIATLKAEAQDARERGDYETAYRLSKRIVILACERDMAKRAERYAARTAR